MDKEDLQRRLRNNRSAVWSSAIHNLGIVLLHLEGTAAAHVGQQTVIPISAEKYQRSRQYLVDLMEALDALSETS